MDNFPDSESFQQDEKSFDFWKIILRALRYWYILPICLVITLAAVFYLYKSTVPLYKVNAQLLISGDQKEVPTIGSAEGALPGINIGAYSNIENQLVILTSTKQIEKTLANLDFQVSYFEDETFYQREIYNESPFTVKLETPKSDLVYRHYNIKFTDEKTFELTKDKNPDFKEKHVFFEKINLDGNEFAIIPNEDNIGKSSYLSTQYSFTINSEFYLVSYYKSRVSINNFHRGSSVFDISLDVNNVQKGKDFINELARNSVNYTLEKKNQVANNTIRFIESQLIGVGDSLSVAKSVLENFRSRNEMMDVSAQGQMIIDKTQELQVEKNLLQTQLDYFNYLVDYMKGDQDVLNLLPPSAYGVENPMIGQMITELSTLNAEKEGLQFNSKIENPNVARIARRMDVLKRSIEQQAQSNIQSTNKAINGVDQRLMALSRDIRRLPKQEQKLLDIERKFQTTDKMYTYLIERRSDAQLAKAANTPDNEVVEYARAAGIVKPNVKTFLIMVVFFGVFLPFGIIFLIVMTNNKILDREDLESKTQIPLIGVVPRWSKSEDILNGMLNPRSSISETIRSIRTSLEFYPTNGGARKILLTSGLPGEGKSITSVNIAISYAQLGKKTLLIDFDMRRPTIDKVLKIKSNGTGLSRHLSSTDKDMHLIETTEYPNLDVIPAGVTPPNPAELIARDRTNTLLQELERLYEVIVIDSPPIGLVTDAALLQKYADLTIFVTRHNHTPKAMLFNLLKDSKVTKIKNLCLLLNDLPVTKRAYNSYAYSGKYYD
nr:polysaccharide biosynthesis tyrosine autokinase [uncultured Carboxylicivirga sp.]